MSIFRSTYVVALLSAMLLTSCAASEQDAELDAIRGATEKYRDVQVALAEGYIPDPSGACVSAAHEGLPAELGAMGIHYLNPALLKITATEPRVDGESTHTDFMNPAILLYEPHTDGSLELVSVENLVFQAAWTEAGNDGPPVFQDRRWDHMVDDPATEADEAHAFMPHYDQHIWLYRNNPSGMLMPFNPAVTCEHHMVAKHG